MGKTILDTYLGFIVPKNIKTENICSFDHDDQNKEYN